MAREVRPLTGLRGLAACAVMAKHCLVVPPSAVLAGIMIDHGYIAVDLFLMLSGFVLAMTYEASFAATTGIQPFRRFVVHRVARIYPLFLATTLLCFLLLKAGLLDFGDATVSWPALAANLAMVQSWGWPDNSLNAPAWSISTEWAANLFFPCFVIIFLRLSRRMSLASAGAAVLIVAGCALIPDHRPHAPIQGSLNIVAFPRGLSRCAAEFGLGVFCWRLRAETQIADRLGRTPVLAAVLAALLLLMPFEQLDLLEVPVLAALILGLSAERSPIAAAFGSPVLRALGLISYSIYLIHVPLFPLRALLLAPLQALRLPFAGALASCLLMLLTIGAAALTYRFLERPAQDWIRRRFGRRPPEAHKIPATLPDDFPIESSGKTL